MRRRVGLQNKTWRPPRLLLGEVAQANATAGAESHGIVQHGMHLLIPGHAIDAPFVEIDDGAGFAQLLMRWKRIGEELGRERIEVEMRNAGRDAMFPVQCCLTHLRPPALCPWGTPVCCLGHTMISAPADAALGSGYRSRCHPETRSDEIRQERVWEHTLAVTPVPCVCCAFRQAGCNAGCCDRAVNTRQTPTAPSATVEAPMKSQA